MDINQKLEKLLLQQKEITKDYGKILKDLSYDNLINENEILKGKVSDYENDLAHLHSKNQKLDEDLSNLRRAYNQQLLNEKTDILQSSKKKIQLYFEDNQRANTNKLKNLEYYIKQKLAKLDGQMTTEVEIDKKEFEDDISRIYSKLDRAIEEKRVSMQYQEQDISQSIDENYQSLQNEEISEEVKKKKEKYNNIELKIGLNLLNKVAVVIILIGVITAMRYTYSNFFNDYVKGIFVYLIGGLFLLGGEVFHRKDKKIFSLGLIGGGIGILYIAKITFVAYSIKRRYG